MNSNNLQRIIDEFQDWYENDVHSTNINFYENIITKAKIGSFSNKELVDFFYEFVEDGGKIQSGGERAKNTFKKTVEKDIKLFRSFVLEPFNEDFDLQSWFNRIEEFKGFGIGIATIYLNRVSKIRYPVMNNKTLTGLKKLGFGLSSTKNFTNYLKVHEYQNNLMKKFPILENYYKTDALNHFIVAIHKGQEIIKQIDFLEDTLEQSEIEEINRNKKLSENDLYSKIRDCEKDDSEIITIKGKQYKRHNYLMVQIKKYRNFKCQFCKTTILKKNGEYYIEACHIKAKAEGGKDRLENILILCPNCHKLFDYAKRKDEKFTTKKYHVTLNGKKYKASIK
ncbi:HNH endonuclease [Draconibacterium sediminis]|uniref:HNH endonuclease n=1 Tax=Draconibacterium sediminis TaxID=1544798 RepID=UPI0026F3017D|nr:HNH endonuclease [Draconibacterium sediminis]